MDMDTITNFSIPGKKKNKTTKHTQTIVFIFEHSPYWELDLLVPVLTSSLLPHFSPFPNSETTCHGPHPSPSGEQLLWKLDGSTEAGKSRKLLIRWSFSIPALHLPSFCNTTPILGKPTLHSFHGILMYLTSPSSRRHKIGGITSSISNWLRGGPNPGWANDTGGPNPSWANNRMDLTPN